MNERKEKNIHRLFVWSVVLKGAHAVLEIVLGIFLLFTDAVNSVIVYLTTRELLEDPADFFLTHVHSLPLSPHALQFGAFYLLSHGIIKIFLVAGLLRNKLWAYPASMVFLVLFMLYQVMRFFETHSIMLVLLTVFDIFVFWLVWHEYRRALPPAASPNTTPQSDTM